MIVTCPACATRFLVDPRSLGTAGRSVRCTHCNHVWMQLPAEDAPRRVDLPPPGTERPVAPRMPGPVQAYAPRGPSPSQPPPEYDSPPTAASPATPRAAISVGADNTISRGSNRPLIAVAVLVLILGALWYGRGFLIDNIPALQNVYALFGVASVGDPNSDLEIRRVTSNRHQENGRATLVIEGEVANISDGSRRVPPVRITLEDSGRHPVKSWTVMATRDPLMPGESVPFHSSVADPGVDTIGASVSFDGGTD